MTTDYNRDYKIDDNISLPGIAGYVLSDKLRFPDNTTAADHCVVRPYPLARCALERAHLAHKTALPKRPKEGAREWKGSIVSAAKSRLDDARHTPPRPPPNKGATASKTKPCSVFSGRFLSPKNHVWKGKGELP